MTDYHNSGRRRIKRIVLDEVFKFSLSDPRQDGIGITYEEDGLRIEYDLANDGGYLMGWFEVKLVDGIANLNDLYLEPGLRESGLGREMEGVVENLAKRLGCSSLRTIPSNKRRREQLERRGYHKLKRNANMEKKL